MSFNHREIPMLYLRQPCSSQYIFQFLLLAYKEWVFSDNVLPGVAHLALFVLYLFRYFTAGIFCLEFH